MTVADTTGERQLLEAVVPTGPCPDVPLSDLRDVLVRVPGPDPGVARWLLRPGPLLHPSIDRSDDPDRLARYRAWRRRFEVVERITERWQLAQLAPLDPTGWLSQLLQASPDGPAGGWCGDVPAAATDELSEAIHTVVDAVDGRGVELVSDRGVQGVYLSVADATVVADGVQLAQDGTLTAGGVPVSGWRLDRSGSLHTTDGAPLPPTVGMLAPGADEVTVRPVPAARAAAAVLVGLAEAAEVAHQRQRPVHCWQVAVATAL